jgi:hypothetical protein
MHYKKLKCKERQVNEAATALKAFDILCYDSLLLIPFNTLASVLDSNF